MAETLLAGACIPGVLGEVPEREVVEDEEEGTRPEKLADQLMRVR